MHLPVIQLINFTIILVVMIFLVKYLWDMFFGETYEPPALAEDRKQKRIDSRLLKLAHNYSDKVRLYNFWLQINRLETEKVVGDMAELGVYKGHSARLLRLMAPGRKFHLFDTFEGFAGSDLAAETGKAATYSQKDFAGTQINKVVETVGGDPALLIIHKGYFPQSAQELADVKFAFVNIDADLYNPTKAGLEYFYPRLSPGGVIFVHDYNQQWEGLMKAVNEFTATIPETPVLVPDLDSTLMIVKSKRVDVI